MDRAEVGRLAKGLGHSWVAIGQTASGRRWFIECACGWGKANPRSGVKHPVTRATDTEAIRSAQHHLTQAVQKVLEKARADGVSERQIVGGRL